ADCRVRAVAIVEPFDELEEPTSRWATVPWASSSSESSPACLARLVAGCVIELGLYAAEEALHGRVVPAISLAAHGATHAVAGEQTTIGMSCVLGGFKWSSQQDLLAYRSTRQTDPAFAHREARDLAS